jgi:hypothetical protein
MAKGITGTAAGGGALYGLGIFGALFYFWQQADSFWEYVWAIFPKAIFWPAYMVYEGFRPLERDLGALVSSVRLVVVGRVWILVIGGAWHLVPDRQRRLLR